MSSIEFVVRNAAGALQRGFVAGENGSPLILAQAGSDISLNLTRSMIAGYRQDGDSLRVALTDGREIVIDGYFDAAGTPVADLFISADGELAKVELTAGTGGVQFASYAAEDAFGKWSPQDDLYFVGGDAAVVAPYVDDEVGMLAGGLPLLGGLGMPLLGLLGLGAGAAVLGGGEEREEPEIDVAFTSGTRGTGHVVNGVDQEDGATITGTGTPGGTVTVEIGGHVQTAVVGSSGEWTVTFPPAEVPRGEYEEEITLTITKGELTKTEIDILDVDTEVAVTFNAAITGDDGIVNAVEQDGRVKLSGTVDAGARVSVLINGETFEAVVTGTSWTLLLPDGFLAEGGGYMQEATVTAIDEHDNVNSVTGSFEVDTELQVTFNAAATGGNGVVNAVEQDGVVTLSGGVDSDATSVVVIVNGTSFTATISGSSWSVELPAGFLPTGETFSQAVTVNAIDDAGNTATTNGSFTIDTELAVTIAPTGAGGDLIVNDLEQPGVVRVQGTVDTDAESVRVTLNGSTFEATVAGGSWFVDLPAGFLPGADVERVLDIQVRATDVNGNVATTAGTVEVDTWVNTLNFTGAPVGGDGMLNRGEAQSAITLTGQVEHDAGLGRVSTVDVVFRNDDGTVSLTRAATVTGGTWSVTFGPGELPQGEYGASFEVIATDHAGNVRSITQAFEVDTAPPDAPLIESYTRSGDGVRAFSVETTDETIAIHAVAGDGTVGTVNARAVANPFVEDETIYDFSSAPVPNGSHLVMTATDAAGNATSTLFALEETLTNTINVGNPGLDGFNIEAIDLQFAEDSVLTLTAAELEGLCAHSNHLTVHGGADDTVNILGATGTGETETIGGRTYAVYSFGGNGGTLVIDEAITVNT